MRRRKSIWAISLFCGEVEGEEMTAVSSGVAWMGSGIGSMRGNDENPKRRGGCRMCCYCTERN